MTSPAIDNSTLEEMRRIQTELRQLSARLDSLISKAAASAPIIRPPAMPQDDPWLKSFYEWINSHEPLDHIVDDSRDTIYEEALRGRA